MNRCPWLALALLALLSGCQADSTGADTRNYACTQDVDCATGFACLTGVCQRPGTPPLPTEELDAGTPSDGGTGSGPAARLGFVTSSQTVAAGECSRAATVEAQTAAGGAATVDSAVTVTLSTSAGSGAAFYLDAACTTATSTTTVAAGTSRATFYFRGTTAQGVNVTAAASGLTSAQQLQTVRAAAPASLVFTTSAQTLEAGACSARVELELRDAYANLTSFSVPTRLTPSGTGLYFSSDGACNTAITDVTLTPGGSRTSFYFRGRPSSLVRLVASVAGLPAVEQGQTIQALQTTVRAGYCELGPNATSVQCAISPALTDTTKTLLIIQAVGPGLFPSEASARCWLASRSAITCSRNSASGGDVFPIWWKTVEMGRGLKVQHRQITCSTSATTLQVTLTSSVSSGNTFLLVSSEVNGRDLDADDFFTAKLTSATQVDLQFSTPCSMAWKGALQVVELTGARVTRGVTSMINGSTQAYSDNQSAVDLGTSALLFTHRATTAGSFKLCDRMLRGDLTSTTSVNFYRSASGSGCGAANIDEIAWERIDFGPLARVQTRLIEFPAGNRYPAAPVAITAVETARTVAFATSQAIGGQAGGESNHDNPVLSEALAGLPFTSATELGAQRIPNNTYSFTKLNACVVQFEP